MRPSRASDPVAPGAAALTRDSRSRPSLGAGPPDWSGTDRYEVRSCLGKGGMGIVYEVFDRERGHLVALKTLIHFDAAALYLFKQEFRTLADVHHHNLVHLYELVAAETGEVFFTMELVRGTDFLRFVQRRDLDPSFLPPTMDLATSKLPAEAHAAVRPAEPAAATPVTAGVRSTPADEDRLRAALRQLAGGVSALHAAGKLHRDIKPSNVLVTGEGRVVLLDFGVATELSTRGGSFAGGGGEVVGTPRYMAPEQAGDEAPTPASDWYSVGVMLYEALAGQPPFVGSTTYMLTMKSNVDPLPPSTLAGGVPDDLNALCLALLHRDPDMRPKGDEILRRLGAARSSASPPPLGKGETDAAFIGREKELEALREAFESARAGRSVTVRVSGASGMGKSTIVHHFLDELADGDEAVVLRGRAYERETVPYKAVDAVVDALSRHLVALADVDESPPVPEDAWLLARLFPVLGRVPGIGPPAERPAVGPQGGRRRAFAALRELLVSLGLNRPVVVFLDDVQWGDVDSAALLLELLRPPNAPALLLVMTHRDGEAERSPFLTEMRERWPEGVETRDVAVGPLEVPDAVRLALKLLESSDEIAQRAAQAVARESRGSPFLVEELVRSNRGAPVAGPTLAVVTLEQMVGERLERLPEPARRLIELVAVGGRPLPVPVVAAASGTQDCAHELIALVSERRFARTGLRGGHDVVETTHDRVRETIVARLSESTLREHHRALARALEDLPGADAEAIAAHWLGADDTERGALFAERAAEQAVAKLAFDQAARLLRRALENTPASSPDAQRLRVKLAGVLQEGGRYAESASAYVDAAERAPGEDRLEFRLSAAGQLLVAGRIHEGSEMLRDVLDAVGVKAPRSPIAAVFWLLVYRAWLVLLGLRFKEREADQVSREDRLRVDALFTAAIGLSIVDVVVGACLNARHFIEAIRAGDRFQLMRAVAFEVGHLDSQGKREDKRELALLALARDMAMRDGRAEAHTYVEGARGIGLWQRGRWAEARDALERGLRVPRHAHLGFSSVRLFDVYTRYYMGDLHENTRRMRRLWFEAEDRGDLYTLVNLGTGHAVHHALIADDPERGRLRVRKALALWPQTGFFLQHWQTMAYGVDLDLYTGDAAGAYERFVRQMPALKRSFLLHAGFIRATTYFAHGRAAIASIDARPDRRRERLAAARGMVRRLDRETNPWPLVLAAMLQAALANAERDRAAAIAALRTAVARAQASETRLYEWPARYRLGELLGGDEGRAFMAGALEEMTAQGIRNPTRWLAVYMPGTWTSA